MRLYQGLESSGRGSGGLGFDFASGAQPGGSELSRKMNRIRRSLLVVFLSFGALFVKRDVLCCGLINLPFRKKKKGKKMTSDSSGCPCLSVVKLCLQVLLAYNV